MSDSNMVICGFCEREMMTGHFCDEMKEIVENYLPKVTPKEIALKCAETCERVDVGSLAEAARRIRAFALTLSTQPEELSKLRDDALADVERRLHDMKNLQRASAWPHVEGVARAEKMVREMRACWQPSVPSPQLPPDPCIAICRECKADGVCKKLNPVHQDVTKEGSHG